MNDKHKNLLFKLAGVLLDKGIDTESYDLLKELVDDTEVDPNAPVHKLLRATVMNSEGDMVLPTRYAWLRHEPIQVMGIDYKNDLL